MNLSQPRRMVDLMRRRRRPAHTTARAKALRKEMTPEERRLWWYLRDRFPDVRWRRQEPIGPFIADFVCYAAQLVVEVDGSQHLASDWDDHRDDYIRCCGFEVLRFDNGAVITRIEDVLDDIGDTMRTRLGEEPPQAG